MNSSLLKSYFAVISARYRMLLQYRAAAIAGFCTQLFWGFIKIMVLSAFFAINVDADHPMTLTQVITYIWLGQAFLGLLPWNTDGEITELVNKGGVAYELVRPLDLYTFWFCRTIALRTATTTLRSIPMVLFAILALPLLGFPQWAMELPPNASAGLWFLVSLLGTLLLATSITMLMHVVLVWTISAEGINRIMAFLLYSLSGMTLPLPLFPDWMQGFLNWQPFRGLVDVPFRIFSGNISGSDVYWDIGHQYVWAVFFIVLGRWVLARSMHRVVVQGG